ncbi:MAG: S1 RNA-binding domain-containing protein, partial [Rhodothermia bacterium]|nr:S1 RNA-binding domain-containing protein [Rhodothermia bacterium]
MGHRRSRRIAFAGLSTISQSASRVVPTSPIVLMVIRCLNTDCARAQGTIINGKIRNLANYGAFIEIEPGIDGLLHVSDMSWTEKISHPNEKYKKGDEVE